VLTRTKIKINAITSTPLKSQICESRALNRPEQIVRLVERRWAAGERRSRARSRSAPGPDVTNGQSDHAE